MYSCMTLPLLCSDLFLSARDPGCSGNGRLSLRGGAPSAGPSQMPATPAYYGGARTGGGRGDP